MSPELELQLDRLADLLARRGTTEYFANPLVTPEPKWFPERWTPDLGSVRTVLTRLANYCGLSGLGIEVGLFVRERDPNFLPSILERSRVERGAAALYMGTHENVAYFAVEEETLRHPEDLKGILAHEMAHAWRHACGLAVDDRKLEEELTDLTTIVLGFGILTTNASYSYEAYGSITGAMAYSGWSHRSSGYLPVETMSFLLAIHAVTRNEDLRQLRSHLNLTQRVAFERAAEWAEMMEIQERLGLPSSSVRAIPRLQGAGELTLPLSRAGSEIREALQRLREQTGEHGGLASSWLPLSVPVCVERNYPLAYWGRANLQGGRWRQLSLVSDPEWAIELLVLESFEEGRFERAAIGFLPDDTCGKKQNLESALTPLFEPASPLADRVMPDVPALRSAAHCSRSRRHRIRAPVHARRRAFPVGADRA